MQCGLVGEQAGEPRVQFADRMRLVEAETLLRALRAEAESVPGLAFLVFLAAEQQAARPRAGDDHHHRLGLRAAGEIVEMAVVAVGKVRVAVADALGRGRDHRDAALHRLRETCAPRTVQGRIEFVQFHVFVR